MPMRLCSATRLQAFCIRKRTRGNIRYYIAVSRMRIERNFYRREKWSKSKGSVNMFVLSHCIW